MSAQINLYNPAFLAKREWVTPINLLLGFVVMGLAMGILGVWYQWQLSGLAAEAAVVERELVERQDQVARLNEEVRRIKRDPRLEARVLEAETMLRGREEIARALSAGVLGTSEGFSGYLRAFARQTVSGVWLTGLSISAGGEQMRIQGSALNAELVPAYIRRLTEEKAMRGREFATLQMELPPEREAGTPEAAAGSEAAATPAPRPPPRVLNFTLAASTESTPAARDAAKAAGEAR